MVTGIDSFKEWFKGSENQYAIIGGTACDILMTEEGLDFRATKDIDLVLIIEAVDADGDHPFCHHCRSGDADRRIDRKFKIQCGYGVQDRGTDP